MRRRIRQHGKIPPLLRCLAERRRNLVCDILIDILQSGFLRFCRCGVLIRFQKCVRHINFDLLVRRPSLVDLRLQIGNHLLHREDSAFRRQRLHEPRRLHSLTGVCLNRCQRNQNIRRCIVVSFRDSVCIQCRTLRDELRPGFSCVCVTDKLAADLLDALASGILLFNLLCAVLNRLLVAVDLMTEFPILHQLLNSPDHFVGCDLRLCRCPGELADLRLSVHRNGDIYHA